MNKSPFSWADILRPRRARLVIAQMPTECRQEKLYSLNVLYLYPTDIALLYTRLYALEIRFFKEACFSLTSPFGLPNPQVAYLDRRWWKESRGRWRTRRVFGPHVRDATVCVRSLQAIGRAGLPPPPQASVQ